MSSNVAAIRNQHNVYYLNGAAKMEEAEPLFVAGTVFFYSRLSGGMEQLTSVGPINESLFIEVNTDITLLHYIIVISNATYT